MKKLLSLSLLLLLAPSAKSALLDNIAGFWKLDETSGNAIDANGNYPGTVTGTTRGLSGKFGYAYSFDGTPAVMWIWVPTPIYLWGHQIIPFQYG
jgi:hypothetical protein